METNLQVFTLCHCSR